MTGSKCSSSVTDGTLIYTGQGNGMIKMWTENKKIHAFEKKIHHSNISYMLLSADNNSIVSVVKSDFNLQGQRDKHLRAAHAVSDEDNKPGAPVSACSARAVRHRPRIHKSLPRRRAGSRQSIRSVSRCSISAAQCRSLKIAITSARARLLILSTATGWRIYSSPMRKAKYTCSNSPSNLTRFNF